mgnify:CR=1 FL=1
MFCLQDDKFDNRNSRKHSKAIPHPVAHLPIMTKSNVGHGKLSISLSLNAIENDIRF